MFLNKLLEFFKVIQILKSMVECLMRSDWNT
jgi:hypothetical protein